METCFEIFLWDLVGFGVPLITEDKILIPLLLPYKV